ncbi:LCP family protein required for cell wall assembly [Nocardioides zeae]|uniref:LCP family protein required for cell wall assembly n=2 Tax=Nocardioides zeae TaxID=1457234 RepID=A0ACC6IK90_9ACTN|nr:LCP family protein [Nocardioides zeae]MDQ1106693.1 LCP family protein required for cell wall assembly [Nocardioides zeae]MDR6173642.1 LCP family protein required for cell wall assembly [Nocardioides zeae]MDR6211048.1 LCP family protein required for cell wall assembly [Nocardioides zeae]
MSVTPPSPSGRRAAPKRRARSKRRHTVATVITATAAILCMVTALGVAFTVRQFDNGINTFGNEAEALGDRPDKVDADTPEEPLNILLVGSDANNPDNGARSDTTIIMHLSGDRDFAYGVSLPRDALVDRPECLAPDGTDVPGEKMVMFNTAYSEGGALCTQKTVESLTDIRIDATIEMDFGGFEDMVDAINGVEICLTEPIRASRYNKALPKEGTFTANGEEALIYVRERHQLSINGDVGRMKRQQAFLASMANKVVSAETLTNPVRVRNFVTAVRDSMTITEEYGSIQKLADIAVGFNGIGLDNINFLTVPNEEYSEDRNRLVWTDEADDLWTLIREDKPLTSEFLTGAIGAEESGGSVNTGEPTASPTDPGSTTTAPSTTDPTDTATDSDPTDDEEFNAEEFAADNGLC